MLQIVQVHNLVRMNSLSTDYFFSHTRAGLSVWGHADRSCYDLDQHTKHSKTPMVAEKRLPEPISFHKHKMSHMVLLTMCYQSGKRG